MVGFDGASLRAVQAFGQKPAESLSFEVASLKQNVSGPGPFGIIPQPGRLMGTNVPARFLIAAGFAPPGGGPLLPYQNIGGPDWLNMARFDLDAKAPESVGRLYRPAGSSLRDAKDLTAGAVQDDRTR